MGKEAESKVVTSIKKLHAVFSGSVQGVGFRFTTERMAHKFPVTGFVRNLPTGGVELVAEGEEEVLQRFLQAVQEAFPDFIRDVKVEWGPGTGEYGGFRIRF